MRSTVWIKSIVYGPISITAAGAAGARGEPRARLTVTRGDRERESIERYVLTSVKRDVERRDRGLESGPQTERRNTEIIAVSVQYCETYMLLNSTAVTCTVAY